MKLLFTMFKYFPYGGLQRDALRIANLCLKAGAEIDICAARLQGDPPVTPEGINFCHLPGKGLSHHAQYLSFAERVQEKVVKDGYQVVVGFNRMPGLDLYFAADPCYAETVKGKSLLYRFTSRCRTLKAFELEVFASEKETVILSISEVQRALFQSNYKTSDKRFVNLPPGVPADRLLPPGSAELGAQLRKELKIGVDELVVLMVGSGFKRKGVDRALNAFKALPNELLQKSRLLVVGDDNLDDYRKMARRVGVFEQVIFTGGRTDIPRFLAAADIFLHPAYQENTGGVLIEALAAALPILVTSVCGYSVHVQRAAAGKVVSEPFLQNELDMMLNDMLTSAEERALWSENARNYVEKTDLFSLAEIAAETIMQVALSKP
ncbi:MAG: glycosyltransferase family 4 protein [Deltaproteobacteria bacterium]|nr:glycosyltransferase family 4 protein [Candidatus Tharpella aukensis]